MLLALLGESRNEDAQNGMMTEADHNPEGSQRVAATRPALVMRALLPGHGVLGGKVMDVSS